METAVPMKKEALAGLMATQGPDAETQRTEAERCAEELEHTAKTGGAS